MINLDFFGKYCALVIIPGGTNLKRKLSFLMGEDGVEEVWWVDRSMSKLYLSVFLTLTVTKQHPHYTATMKRFCTATLLPLCLVKIFS